MTEHEGEEGNGTEQVLWWCLLPLHTEGKGRRLLSTWEASCSQVVVIVEETSRFISFVLFCWQEATGQKRMSHFNGCPESAEPNLLQISLGSALFLLLFLFLNRSPSLLRSDRTPLFLLCNHTTPRDEEVPVIANIGV